MKKKMIRTAYISDLDTAMMIEVIFSDRGGVKSSAEHRGLSYI